MKQRFTQGTKFSNIIKNFKKGAAICGFFFLVLACQQSNDWEIIATYEDGTPKEAMLIYGNKSDSTYLLRKYYASGELKSSFDYIEGKRHGIAMGYYESGIAGLLVNYQNDLREGYEIKWTDKGVLRSRFLFKNDMMVEGSYFYENGQPTADLTFDSLGLVTSGTYFHENGNLRSKGAFLPNSDGVKHGRWELFHENGVLKEAGNYENGERVGSWLFYDSLGNETMNARYTYD